MAKILIVEDEQALSDMVADFLGDCGHTIEQVFTGSEALDRLRLYSYDLVIMDWELPGITGVTVTRQYRQSNGQTPVLFLTGKKELADKIEGFNTGADDYLTKPFQAPELQVRVQALLRRPKVLVADVIQYRHLEIDTASGKVFKKGTDVKVLPKEFALLTFLIKNRGHVFDHTALLDKVWSSESDATSEAIMTCVKRLRKKLDIEGEPSIITTVHGVGYRADG